MPGESANRLWPSFYLVKRSKLFLFESGCIGPQCWLWFLPCDDASSIAVYSPHWVTCDLSGGVYPDPSSTILSARLIGQAESTYPAFGPVSYPPWLIPKLGRAAITFFHVMLFIG